MKSGQRRKLYHAEVKLNRSETRNMRKLRIVIISAIFCSVFSSISFAQPAGRSYLDGVFIAPKGTTVVLQKDGAEELSLTATTNGTADFSRNPFKFPNAYLNGAAYTLAIKSAPE